jgi:CubicO group peptidase (beta-lactamase class C family)
LISNANEQKSKIQQLLADYNLAGIVYTTFDDGQTNFSSSGFANIKSNRRMQLDTKVQVGSVGKVILAVGVLHLISTGKIHLDDSVEDLLPTLDWQNNWSSPSPITIEHLLAHTSGLDNIKMWQLLNSSTKPDTPLEEAFLNTDPYILTPRFEPGTQYSYSNMGYSLLGMIIEAVTLKNYEDYMDSLLAKLNMNDSTFHYVTQENDPRLAMGYFEGGYPQMAVPMLLRPAGQFTTTINDMSQLIQFLLGSGISKNQRIVQAALMNRLGVPKGTFAFESGLEHGHGLALAKRDRHGAVGYCHPGETFGFYANLCLFPEENKAYFFAINTDSESAQYDDFNRTLINQLKLRKDAENNELGSFNNQRQDISGLYILSPNNMLEFQWLDYMFNSIYLTATENGFNVYSLQQGTFEITTVGKFLFRRDGRIDTSHVYYRDGQFAFISDGLNTYKKSSLSFILLNWLALILGCFTLVALIARSFVVTISGFKEGINPILLPFLVLCLTVIPVYLYSQQSFFDFGEQTAASVSLALISACLPFSCLIAALLYAKEKKLKSFDALITLLTLMFTFYLTVNDVLPLIFWK